MMNQLLAATRARRGTASIPMIEVCLHCRLGDADHYEATIARSVINQEFLLPFFRRLGCVRCARICRGEGAGLVR